MAREITVLEVNAADQGQISVRAALWFAVATGPVPKPSFQSAIASVTGTTAITPTELSALQAGTVIEIVKVFNFPEGTSAATIKAQLQAFWNSLSTYLAGLPAQGAFYGVMFDSVTGWSA